MPQLSHRKTMCNPRQIGDDQLHIEEHKPTKCTAEYHKWWVRHNTGMLKIQDAEQVAEKHASKSCKCKVYHNARMPKSHHSDKWEWWTRQTVSCTKSGCSRRARRGSEHVDLICTRLAVKWAGAGRNGGCFLLLSTLRG